MSKQEKLYQLLEAAKVNEGVEELLHEDLAYDDVKPAKLEPEVDIKTEYEAITFEPYDCDVQSGESRWWSSSVECSRMMITGNELCLLQ